MMYFIKLFCKLYWNSFYKWTWRKGAKTKKEEHISNEVIIRIFNAARQLSYLIERKWLCVEHFAEYKQLIDKLNEKKLTTIDQRFGAFAKDHL